MPLSKSFGNAFFSALLVISFSSSAVGSPPALVSDIDQTNQLVQMNQHHVDQIEILNNIKEEITAIKEAIGTGSSASKYFSSSFSGAQVGGANGYADFSNKNAISASSDDVDKLAENILTNLTGINRNSETVAERAKRVNTKKRYISDAVVHGLSVAINIREGISETNKVIEQMADISSKSSASVTDDITVNSRILLEVLKYVAQLGVATAINAELTAADMLGTDDTL